MFPMRKTHNDSLNKWVHTNIAILWTFHALLIYNYNDKAFG